MSTLASWLALLGGIIVLLFAGLLIISIFAAIVNRTLPVRSPAEHEPRDWRVCGDCSTVLIHRGPHDCAETTA